MSEKQPNNYRGYFFGNMYLSSIQQGIQSSHVIQDMYSEYHVMSNSYPAKTIFNRWMHSDKTMILLNGGYQSSLRALYEDLMRWTEDGTVYPVGRFYEEQDALNGALTSVGIILPESVYAFGDENMELVGGEPAKVQADDSFYGLKSITLTCPDNKDYSICKRIKEFKLAN